MLYRHGFRLQGNLATSAAKISLLLELRPAKRRTLAVATFYLVVIAVYGNYSVA